MRCPTLEELPPAPKEKLGWPWTEESPQLSETMPDGSSWPKVGIVTPSYNHEKFIEETIRSVLLQGYPNLEFIIIDDGSTDHSGEIIQKYEKWLAYWTIQPRQGQPLTVNRGFQKTDAEFLSTINSDDLYEPGVIADGVKYLKEHPEAGAVFGNVLKVNSDNTRQILTPERAIPLSLEECLKKMCSPGTTAAFIRRVAMEKVGYFNPEYHYWLDPELWIRIALQWKLGHIQHNWYRMRRHPHSKTVTSPIQFAEEQLKVAQELCQRKDLPTPLLKIKPKVLAMGYLRAATGYAVGGQLQKAIQCYQEALHGSFWYTTRWLSTRKFGWPFLSCLLSHFRFWRDFIFWIRKQRTTSKAI